MASFNISAGTRRQSSRYTDCRSPIASWPQQMLFRSTLTLSCQRKYQFSSFNERTVTIFWNISVKLLRTVSSDVVKECRCFFGITAITRSSAVAERPRVASCLSVVSFNIQRSFFITSYCGFRCILVREIILNNVLLSPIVSGGVRPNTPGQTPLGHNPPCLLLFVGRLGSGPRLAGPICMPSGVIKNGDRVRSTG